MEHFPVPKVLECMHFVATCPPDAHRRIVRDYEFDYYIDGERDIYLDGVHHHLSKGCLVLRRPGQFVVGYGDYNMYLLTLDFSGREDDSGTPYYRRSVSVQQPACEFDLLSQIPTVFVPAHQEEIKGLYEKLFECSHPNIPDPELQRSYITEFLLLVLADVCRNNRQHTVLTSLGNPHVKKICKYINDHYSGPLTVESIAAHFSLNKNYLIRLFRQGMNTTPNQYVLETRLLRARNLLLQTNQPVQLVAQSCGFNTPSYFIKCFRNRFGKSPLQYKNDHILEAKMKKSGNCEPNQ